MNCFYFAMERCRTFKENKKIKQKKETKTKTNTKNKNWNKYKKQNNKTTDKQTNQNKTKPKYTNERTKNTLHTLTKVLTSCHTSIENQKESYAFISSVELIPFSQYSPSNPGGDKHRYPLSVNPDWQVALFSQ